MIIEQGIDVIPSELYRLQQVVESNVDNFKKHEAMSHKNIWSAFYPELGDDMLLDLYNENSY